MNSGPCSVNFYGTYHLAVYTCFISHSCKIAHQCLANPDPYPSPTARTCVQKRISAKEAAVLQCGELVKVVVVSSFNVC